MDEYAWSVLPEPPYIFPVPPTPSNNSNGPPQKQPGLRMPTTTFLTENLPNDTPNPYTPCDAVSPPLATNPASHVFNLSQFYSTNASAPTADKTLPTPPFAFGDIQSSFAFNVDEFWPTLGYEDHSSTSDLSSIPDPIIVPGDELSLSPKSRVSNLVSETSFPPSESASTPGSPACSENSKVATVPRKARSPRRSATRPSKKCKTAEDESDDESTLLQCCMMVKPESLSRHLKSDGHKRNAGLPTDRPEVCTTCNIAFARQDARNRHFRSQHGGKVPPDAHPRLLYGKIKRPSATHPSILSRKHK
ncbi:hypothetical protein EDB89DRAFT_58940 [Lactarius sanguifluus]|nr:hypothetical protein EDB89DRAFT_58940 [Lactarius sanguifluus]